MRHNKKQAGFSMIETLIAMTVFSVGFIGVAQFTGEALKRGADDNSRAVSLNAMSKLMSPLYVAALGTPTQFKLILDTFTTANGRTIQANNNRETYTVKIIEAQDDSATSIINDALPNNWLSPITVGVRVTYTGATGTITSQAPYTFQLSAP